MKRQITPVFLALALLSEFVCANDNGDITRDAIIKMYADLRLAVETSDLSRYSKYLHADASLRPPGEDGINGKKNYLSLMATAFASANHHITIKKSPEVTMLGDTALVGGYRLIKRELSEPCLAERTASETAKLRDSYNCGSARLSLRIPT